jgi:hypothetical protein
MIRIGLQKIVQVQPFEQAFTHIGREILFFNRRMDQLNRPLGCVQDYSTVIALLEMLFQFLTQGGSQVSINIGRQGS